MGDSETNFFYFQLKVIAGRCTINHDALTELNTVNRPVAELYTYTR